jgi:porin
VKCKVRMKNGQIVKTMLAALLLVLTGALGYAQSGTDPSSLPETPAPAERSIEDLNLVGSDVAMPPFSDSLVDVNSGFRQALFSKGIALRVISNAGYSQNVLQAPVPADEQVYVGERPFGNAMVQPILTYNLRQLHLHKAQLYISGVGNWVSWNPAGPKTFQLWALYFYKMFGEDLVEVKAGYICNDLEFVGLQVGGSTAIGAQGVYAVLPFEVGLSYFPLTAPSFNIRIRRPKHTYLKIAAQRSLDPGGGPTTVARDHAGFRFIPKGDRLLLINEVGYRRPSSPTAREAWFRAGYMRNSTLYTNPVTGQRQPGNFCGYLLMDYQLRKPDPQHPSHGLYVGVSAMTVPATLDPYARYYEVRLYQKAPFRSRPGDVISFVASRTGYSRAVTDKLVAEGKTVWRSGTSFTGSYSILVAPGVHVSVGLSYIHGPAITPRVSDTLTFTAGYTVFF